MKMLIAIWLLCAAFCLTACDRSEADRVTPFGPNHPSSLVVFFKIGTTHEQIEAFYDDVVNVESKDLALRYRLINGKYVGVAVNFSTDTTFEQRERLKRRVQESPIVHRFYENVVPREINDL